MITNLTTTTTIITTIVIITTIIKSNLAVARGHGTLQHSDDEHGPADKNSARSGQFTTRTMTKDNDLPEVSWGWGGAHVKAIEI